MEAGLLERDCEMPVEFESPLLGSEPPSLVFTDLPTAIWQLETELESFDQYFAQNQDDQPTNPVLSPLNKAEWRLLWDKHFTHYFKQFGLV